MEMLLFGMQKMQLLFVKNKIKIKIYLFNINEFFFFLKLIHKKRYT